MRNILTKIIGLTLFPNLTFAAQSVGFAMVADSLMDPVNIAGSFLNSACFLIGGAFLFASIIKFFEHRRSPTMVPISTIVFLLVAGLILLLLPFMAHINSTGVHYRISQ